MGASKDESASKQNREGVFEYEFHDATCHP